MLDFIQANTEALRVDSQNIGIMASSSNVPTVMAYLMQPDHENIRFAVHYYGVSLSPNGHFAEGFARDCARRGCLYAELADPAFINPRLPLFIVQAGQDFIPNINEAMDQFITYVEDGGAQVTMIDYEEGVHGFDTKQQTEESAKIIADTLDFMQANFEREEGPRYPSLPVSVCCQRRMGMCGDF